MDGERLIKNPYNDYLDRGHYGISYCPRRGADPLAGMLDSLIGITPGGSETAICFAGDHFILHGDHRRELQECGSLAECMGYFLDHFDQITETSGSAEDFADAWERRAMIELPEPVRRLLLAAQSLAQEDSGE